MMAGMITLILTGLLRGLSTRSALVLVNPRNLPPPRVTNLASAQWPSELDNNTRIRIFV
jgi:hypothetical protein